MRHNQGHSQSHNRRAATAPAEPQPESHRAGEPQSRRATEPESHRGAEPQRRRAAEPQRRATEPQSRRATEPQSHRATGRQSRRATEPQSHRATEPQSHRGPKGPRSNGISNNGAHRNPNGFYFTLSFDLTFEVSIGCSSSPADRGYCTAQNVPGHLPADISDVDVCDSPECVVLYLCVVHFTSAPLGESTLPSGIPVVLGAGRSSRSRTAAH